MKPMPEQDPNWRRIKVALSMLRRVHAACQRILEDAGMMTPMERGTATAGVEAPGGPIPRFENVPHVQVSRGQLLDGPKGQAVPWFTLGGAKRQVLAQLLLNESVHGLEVVALQTRSGLGKFSDRKGHARTTIATLRAAIRRLGVDIAKADGRRSNAWVLLRNGAVVTFSVDHAKAITEHAVDELRKGKTSSAVLAAMDALACDDLIQEAHEVLCNAAVTAGTVGNQVEERIGKSIRHLARRVEQLTRGLQICENSLATEDDETVRTGLELQTRKFATERERLQRLIANTTECFGPFDQGSPKDRPANEAIQELRRRNLTFEQAWGHPLFVRVLGHPSVGWLLDEIVKQAKARGRDEQTALRDRMKAEVLVLVLDPGARPNIRWICKAVKHLIPQILELGTSSVPADVKTYEEAVDAFKKEYGRRPYIDDPEDLEELSRLSGLSHGRLKAAAEWRTSHRHNEIVAFDRQRHKKRRSDDSYGDDDDDHGEDEADDEEGLAGTCAPRR